MRYLFLLVLVGCGAPFEPKSTCHTSNGLTVYQERDRGCNVYEQTALEAEALLIQAGFVDRDLYDQKFQNIDLWVHDDTPAIICSVSGASAGGCYHPNHRFIETTKSAGGLAHELLHHLDWLHGLDRVAHDGWGREGSDLSGTPYRILSQGNRDVFNQDVYPGSWLDITQRWEYYTDAKFREQFGDAG